jgi:hypothetical protein
VLVEAPPTLLLAPAPADAFVHAVGVAAWSRLAAAAVVMPSGPAAGAAAQQPPPLLLPPFLCASLAVLQAAVAAPLPAAMRLQAAQALTGVAMAAAAPKKFTCSGDGTDCPCHSSEKRAPPAAPGRSPVC